MNRLVVLRHAKSEWPPQVGDHDRPLSPRGLRDAPRAGAWIAEHVGELDQVIVSDAVRARETWDRAGGALMYAGPTSFDPRVYNACLDDLLAVLAELPDHVGTVLLVGHNPGCGELATHLSGPASDAGSVQRLRTKYPTCGIAVLSDLPPWGELIQASGRLTDFAAPRG